MGLLKNKKCFISVKTDAGFILKFREVIVKDDDSPTHIIFTDLLKNKTKMFRKEDILEAYEI